MTRYLLTTWEGGGNVGPELAIAKRLLARGHEVRVLGDPASEDAIRATGCAFSVWDTAPKRQSLAPEDDLLRDWEFKNPLKLFEHGLRVFVSEPAARFAADTGAVLDRHPADVVLADMMMFGSMMVAEARRLPCAALIPNISMRPATGVPPFGMGLALARGPFGYLRDAVLGGLSQRLWKKALTGINRARAELGLPPVDDFWAQYDRVDRVLVLTSTSFDFLPPRLPANVRYVGAMLDDPPWAGTWTPPWPTSNHDPIVLVSLSSTFQDQLPVLTRIVATLAQLRVRAIVTLGPALATIDLPSPAAHVVIARTAPHAAILRDAALAITHCGHGTTMRALAAGVPLVCMPMGRDQGDTAARVVHHGAGVRLKPNAESAAIRRAVETVLSDPRYATSARRLADAIARDAQTIDPAALIEALTSRSAAIAS